MGREVRAATPHPSRRHGERCGEFYRRPRMKKLYGNADALRKKQAQNAAIERAKNQKARYDASPAGIEQARIIADYRAEMAPKLAAAEAERKARLKPE